ncbi:MAG: glycosyltransferase family 1 protein [Gemmatimonadetes bacterium]|nr:MAG: glycosyltransferase family 1 protein [Gemmatimonadota bacterium]
MKIKYDRPLHFIVPGSLESLTGGTLYDKQIIDGIRRRGIYVEVHEVPGTFPSPRAEDKAAFARAFWYIPDGSLVVIDGLMLAGAAEVIRPEKERLHFTGLIHHPHSEEPEFNAAEQARLRQAEQAAFRLMDQLIVTSPFTRLLLQFWQLEDLPVTTVLPGTNTQRLARGSRSQSVHLLCVANVLYRKGYSVLVDALARLKAYDWHFTAAGSLTMEPQTVERLRTQIKKQGLSHRIHLTGAVSPAKLRGIYRQSDLFVFPSLYEGYGMALAEAISAGLPVVSTTGGAIPFTTRGAAVLVPPGDVEALAEALRLVLDQPEYRRRLAHLSQKVRPQLPTWQQSTNAFIEAVYGTV